MNEKLMREIERGNYKDMLVTITLHAPNKGVVPGKELISWNIADKVPVKNFTMPCIHLISNLELIALESQEKEVKRRLGDNQAQLLELQMKIEKQKEDLQKRGIL